MKKILAILFLLPALAFAQNLPSPTYKNLSVTGTTTLSTPLTVGNGGTGAASASGTALDNISGFAGTGFVTRTGSGAYSFQSLTNGISLGNLSQAAANTVLANASGSTANVSAFSMPGCSASTNALQWTSGSGFACNSSVNAATLGGATFASPGAIGATTPNTIGFTSGTTTIGPTSTAGATNLNLALTSTYAGPGGGGNNPPNGITVNVSQSGSNANTTKNVRGIVTTAVDGVGNTSAVVANNNFVEGGRFQAVPGASINYAATYGAVTYAAAGAAGFPYQVGVGIESQVDNLYANASAPTTSNSLPLVTSFLASNGEPSATFTADAAFMINPFNPSKFQTGFFAAGNTVSYASFATNATSATYGMDLGLGTYSGSAIRIPNSSAITGRNAAGNSDLNIMYVSNVNTLNLGQDTTSTLLYGSSVIPPVNNTASLGGSSNRWSNIFGVNGDLTGSLAAVGNDALFYQNSSAQSIPNNSATTVTNWTKIGDRVNANFNASTGVYTAPATGYYQVSAQLCWASQAGVSGSAYQAIIVVNGTGVASGRFVETSTVSQSAAPTVSATVNLTAGQTVTIAAIQTSGGAYALSSTATFNYLSIARIP